MGTERTPMCDWEQREYHTREEPKTDGQGIWNAGIEAIRIERWEGCLPQDLMGSIKGFVPH